MSSPLAFTSVVHHYITNMSWPSCGTRKKAGKAVHRHDTVWSCAHQKQRLGQEARRCEPMMAYLLCIYGAKPPRLVGRDIDNKRYIETSLTTTNKAATNRSRESIGIHTIDPVLQGPHLTASRIRHTACRSPKPWNRAKGTRHEAANYSLSKSIADGL
jgi:hypothetical protein